MMGKPKLGQSTNGSDWSVDDNLPCVSQHIHPRTHIELLEPAGELGLVLEEAHGGLAEVQRLDGRPVCEQLLWIGGVGGWGVGVG
jgi:alkylation response protein AidB-like acyl-CoA dehydrogenase